MDMRIAERLDVALENGEFDTLSRQVQSAVIRARRAGGPSARKLSDFLNGDWLGHSLHAMLTDFTIGTLLCADILDILSAAMDNPGLAEGASLLLKLGLLSVPATAAAGIADWQYQSGRGRRIGTLHALINSTAASLMLGSLLMRGGRGNGSTSTTAATLTTAGVGVLMAGAYLGGDLAYRFGIAVNRDAWTPPIRDYFAVADSSAVNEGGAICVSAKGRDIAVFRRDGRLYALDNTCSHMGGPLHSGTVEGGCVTCPWHGSRFRLSDGALVQGPATAPVDAYDVREHDGRIEVRSAREPWVAHPVGPVMESDAASAS